ncbi:PEP-CTERM sorting domain-containing protein [Roseateles cellulosilyticus]|uniref:PEP-CTERM sorting domain-containing protein n=1 Tax=Pelomonas cellulosilytica TaxID=2906762 RepID=A0ABS8XZ05_9BURK|nr:PEP-CTERM sorting domain-containing protein [Pelomonas sp. P8]MCE4557861.1 PEP-CTERM sorting domain-containing protein [Pelomonas sp. P8]
MTERTPQSRQGSQARWTTLAATLAALMLGATASTASAETWTLSKTDAIYLQSPPLSFNGIYFSQGLAFNTQANEWISAWQYGLQRTDLNFNSLQRVGNVDISAPGYIVPGIPAALASQKLDHIGDIDVYNGKIYASLDTTSKDPALGYSYGHGHVAVFNASDLSYTGQSFELVGSPANPHHDVASWVAVDGAAGVGYGKEWQNGNTINVYNLDDWSFSHTLTMDRSLSSIQGAKVFNGSLYMSSDNSTASIYRVSLSTGHVEELFQLPSTPGSHEVEGIALRALPNGQAEMVVEMIVDPDNSDQDLTNKNLRVDLLHYTLAPVPEPATFGLLLAGLSVVGFASRRRR